jgi:hypothetical protein
MVESLEPNADILTVHRRNPRGMLPERMDAVSGAHHEDE